MHLYGLLLRILYPTRSWARIFLELAVGRASTEATCPMIDVWPQWLGKSEPPPAYHYPKTTFR